MDRVRLGAVAGLSGALLFTGGWIVGGVVQPADYSWSRQEISDLGALTAQHAWIWNSADSVSGALLLGFAIGLFPLVRSSPAGRIATVLLGIVGVGSVLDGILREDCPLSTSAACQHLQDGPGLSWHHQAHDIESVIVFLAILAVPFVMAKAIKGIEPLCGLRTYTLATGILQIGATVAYGFLYGEAGGGVVQRVFALAFMAWITVLAIWMLKAAQRPDSVVGLAREDGDGQGDPGDGEPRQHRGVQFSVDKRALL